MGRIIDRDHAGHNVPHEPVNPRTYAGWVLAASSILSAAISYAFWHAGGWIGVIVGWLVLLACLGLVIGAAIRSEIRGDYDHDEDSW